MKAYFDWIEAYVSRQPGRFVRGKCKDAAKEMVAAFPELRLAAGFAHATWGRDQHWWCVTPDGVIVDPTAEQFLGACIYEELDLKDPSTRSKVPRGICMHCGKDRYTDDYFCSAACADAEAAEMNRDLYG